MLKFIEWLLPEWALSPDADPTHSHRRRYTAIYKRKQNIVKNIWISAGLVMLALPAIPLVVALALFTTFISFVVLDETA